MRQWTLTLCLALCALVLSPFAAAIEWTTPPRLLPGKHLGVYSTTVAKAVTPNSAAMMTMTDRVFFGLDAGGNTLWQVPITETRPILVGESVAVGSGFFATYRIRGSDNIALAQNVVHIDGAGNLLERFPVPTSLGYLYTGQSDAWFVVGTAVYRFGTDGSSQVIDTRKFGMTYASRLVEVGDDVFIYGYTGNGNTANLVRSTRAGSRVWQRSLIPEGIKRMSGDPIVDRNVILLAYESTALERRMLGLSTLTGETVWQTESFATNSPTRDIGFSNGRALWAIAHADSSSTLLSIDTQTGQVQARLDFTDSTWPEVATSQGWLVSSSVNDQLYWRMISPQNLSQIWQRPIASTQERLYESNSGNILLTAYQPDNTHRYALINAANGLTISDNQREFTAPTSDVYSYGAEQTIYIPTYSLNATFVAVNDRASGAERNSHALSGFLPSTVNVIEDDLIMSAFQTDTSNNETIVRVVRVGPQDIAPKFDRSYRYSGILTLATSMSAQQMRLVLSCTTCTTQTLVSLADDGSVLTNVQMPRAGRIDTAVPMGTNTLLVNGLAELQSINAQGALLWSTPAERSIGPIEYDPLRNKVTVMRRFSSGSVRDAVASQYDSTNGSLIWRRVLDLGAYDYPQALKILSDGSVLTRIRSFTSESSSPDGYVDLLRLNGQTGEIEAQIRSRSSNNFAWNYYGTVFEERGDELWLSTSRNYGRSDCCDLPGYASVTLRLNKFTLAEIGTHWWGWRGFSNPTVESDDWFVPTVGKTDDTVRYSGSGRLRRSDDYAGGNVDLVVSSPTTELSDLEDSLSFDIDISNIGSSAATGVQVHPFSVEDTEFEWRVSSCTPAASCTATTHGFPQLSIAPGQSVRLKVALSSLIYHAEAQGVSGVFGIVAAPRKQQLELNSDNNALRFSARLAAFSDGFE